MPTGNISPLFLKGARMNADEYGKIIEESSLERDGEKVLPCALAFELSEKHSLPLKDIGTWCTDNGIKIIRCQLGCFE
jgi:hypothetical protein